MTAYPRCLNVVVVDQTQAQVYIPVSLLAQGRWFFAELKKYFYLSLNSGWENEREWQHKFSICLVEKYEG